MTKQLQGTAAERPDMYLMLVFDSIAHAEYLYIRRLGRKPP